MKNYWFKFKETLVHYEYAIVISTKRRDVLWPVVVWRVLKVCYNTWTTPSISASIYIYIYIYQFTNLFASMWSKFEWMGHPMRLELIHEGLLVNLANRYTTRGAHKYLSLTQYIYMYKLIHTNIYVCMYVTM